MRFRAFTRVYLSTFLTKIPWHQLLIEHNLWNLPEIYFNRTVIGKTLVGTRNSADNDFSQNCTKHFEELVYNNGGMYGKLEQVWSP